MPERPKKVKGVEYELSKPDLDLEFKIREELMREKATGGLIAIPQQEVHADCIKFLMECPDGLIDMIFADFPFNIGKNYGPDHNDALSYGEYLGFIREFCGLALKKLKSTGTLVIMNNQRNAPIIFVEALKLGWYWQNTFVWPLRSGIPATNRAARTYQVIQSFTKLATENYFDPFSEMLDPDAGWGRKEKILYDGKRRLHDIWYDIEKVNVKHPEAIRERTNSGGKKGEWRLKYQATQMPLKICFRILRTFALPGGIVLDAFGGSGAFSAAARALEYKKVYTCELNDEYRRVLEINIEGLVKYAREHYGLQTDGESTESGGSPHQLQMPEVSDETKEVSGPEEGISQR
jgi:site-specific DNA-methyltransferase (adenine-specific)